MDIKALRNEYRKGELKDNSVYEDPFKQFEKWFEQALHADLRDVNAMTLATADKSGNPSARIVLLKAFDKEGFVFYTHYKSRKGEDIAENPMVALLFFWKELERQVRIEGKIAKVAASESDQYFDSRELESRISAVISPQSKIVPDRRFLEERRVKLLKEIEKNGLYRPEFWGGYRVIPSSIEFWQGRPSRLHDRIKYFRQKDAWKIVRLAP